MAFKWLRFLFAVSGDRAAIPGPVDVSGNVSYEQGYGPDYQRPKTDPLSKNIERDKMNGLFYDLSGNIQYWQTSGVPDWVPAADNGGVSVSYPLSAMVRYSVDGFVYMSIKAANTDLPTVATSWKKISGGFANIARFTASGSFTVPPGVTTLYVSGCAAGGGGNFSPNTFGNVSGGGGGGGAGQAIIRQAFTVVPGAVHTITIPAAAAGGVNGGNTIVGTIVTLTGGAFGNAGTAGAAGSAPGGIGGAGAPNGGDGGDGGNVAGTGNGGNGASGPFGGGGAGSRSVVSGVALAGKNASGFGAGGGGAGGIATNSNSTGAAGGAGSAGLAIIEW